MGKRLRGDDDGTYHHVFNRGARRDLIFLDDTDRRMWLGIVIDVCEKRGVEIHAFCLMGNHFHLLLRSRGNLDAVMRDACSRYVRAFNRRHGFDGPLHTSPYRNQVIDSDEYFVTVSRYIHVNPAEIWSGPLERYQWSSYRFYLKPDSAPDWLTVSFTLELFGGDSRRYGTFVDGHDRTGRALPTPDGDLSFGPTVPLDHIIHVVANLVGVAPATLATGRAGVRSPARLAVCLLAREHEVAAVATAEALGYASPESIRTCLHRGQKLLQTDAAFSALLHLARQQLAHVGGCAAAA